jgi:hypothetical protein
MTVKSRCSSVVEHFLGREEVVSSILTNGSAKAHIKSGVQVCDATGDATSTLAGHKKRNYGQWTGSLLTAIINTNKKR